MEFVDGLRLIDAVVLLKDRLDELFESEIIPQKTYSRKSSFRQLLRAVNKADIMISTTRKKLQTLAIYLPKGIHIFPMDSHDVFAGQQIDSIVKSTLMQKHPTAIAFFINERPWVTLTGIESEYAQVYKKHPTHTVTTDRQIKRINLTNAKISTGHAGYFQYDTERRVLTLSAPFSEDVFLVFQGRVKPGRIDVRAYNVGTIAEAEETELRDAMITTPNHFEDVLMVTALAKLLPIQTDPVTEYDIISMTSGQESANGPSFIEAGTLVPYFGAW